MDKTKQTAALFDLDGVVFNTEPEYTKFWSGIGKKYRPDIPDLCYRIKGQTLKTIFEAYFPSPGVQEEIIRGIDAFEATMPFPWVEGFQRFFGELKAHGVKTAVVTSSNEAKMASVYRTFPDFKERFDRILTAEDFKRSKPDPDCYLLGARVFDLPIENCVVFEDSFSGLQAGRSSGMKVVALATTNSAESLQGKADVIIPDYTAFNYDNFIQLLNQ